MNIYGHNETCKSFLSDGHCSCESTEQQNYTLVSAVCENVPANSLNVHVAVSAAHLSNLHFLFWDVERKK